MKKFTKLLLSVAAIAAVTAAVATTAMAAEYSTLAPAYADGKVTFDSVETGDTQTLLVISGSDKTAVSQSTIKQIDQQDAKITEATVGTLADGTYMALVGGSNGDIYYGTFKVGNAGSTQLLGDVNDNGEIAVNDATAIVNHILKTTTLTGDNLLAADANDNGEIAVNDVTQVVNYLLKKASNVDGVKTISDKTYQTVE